MEYKTKRERVYWNLQDQIIKGIIRPGSRLVISNLAKQFNVSEIPVREALHMLAQEGYVQLTPHSGVIVSSLSEDDIRQIFEIRINLEGLAGRLASDHLSNANIKTIREKVEQSEYYLKNVDLEKYGQLNREFHEYIYQHANNQRLFTMISELWDYSIRYPNFFTSVSDIENSIREHYEIADALEERDADKIEHLIREHTKMVYRKIIRLVKEMNLE